MERTLSASRKLAGGVLHAPTVDAALESAARVLAALYDGAEIVLESAGRTLHAESGQKPVGVSHRAAYGDVNICVSVSSGDASVSGLADVLALALHARLLSENANADALTGANNRAALDRRLRTGTLGAIALIDIDHFKSYNDTHGHQAGDAVLRRVAHAASASLSRTGDFFARYGGEEFAVALEDAGVAEAIAACERIREAVRGLGIPHAAGKSGRVTISVGFAVAREGEKPEDTLARADAELYRAKSAGRDRVCGERYAGRRGGANAFITPYVPLVGRAEQAQCVVDGLERTGLVTITGAAGIGKTRLALNAACWLAHRFSTIAFADAWAAVDATDLLRRLQPALLNAAQSLAVLDGCEHLLDACSEVVAHLRSRGVTVLAVSRVPLAARDEVLVRLGSLAPAESSELFAAAASSAGAVLESGAPVLQSLLRRLNGSPSAILSAAVAVSVSSPQDVLDDLAQRPPARERATIDSLIGDAFSALNGSAQTFAAASAFAAPFTAAGATALYPHGNVSEDRVERDLRHLQGLGLLAHDGKHWTMAHVLRDAAKEESATAELRSIAERNHLQWCLQRFEVSLKEHGRVESQLFIDWISPIAPELEIALQRGLAQPALTPQALQLCSNAARYFYATSRFSEANRWCNAFLDTGRGDDQSRTSMLVSLARISYVQGRIHDLEQYALQALPICGDDPARQSVIYNYLGIAAKHRSEAGAAIEYFSRSRECARAAGNRRSEAIAISSIGSVSMDLQVDFAAAVDSFTQAIPLMREKNDQLNAILIESNLVEVLACTGEAERACGAGAALVDEVRALGNVPALLLVLSTFAIAALACGDAAAVRNAARESVELLPRLDPKQYHTVCNTVARYAQLRGDREIALQLIVAAEWLQIRDGQPVLPIERYHHERSFSALDCTAEMQREALLAARTMKDEDVLALCARAL